MTQKINFKDMMLNIKPASTHSSSAANNNFYKVHTQDRLPMKIAASTPQKAGANVKKHTRNNSSVLDLPSQIFQTIKDGFFKSGGGT